MSLSIAAFAQTGTIQGTIADDGGAVIPNAQITAFDQDKSVVARQATSGAVGSFVLTGLLPGTYRIRIESPGFRPLDRTDLKLDQNQVMNLGTIVLQLGQVAESITVEAAPPLIETTTAQKSYVITSRQVTEIPLNGRDFQSLIRTLPGVVSNDRSDFRLAFNNTDAFNVNGMRGSANNTFLDGSVNTDVGANDGQYTQISLDAVGEFQVRTSTFNAEYGRNPGVMISISTKSGGSQFHGTAYEFLRNDAFDANSFHQNMQGQKKAKLRFNQFGGNIGGPIPIPGFSSGENKKLFFFFNYEGTRATRPSGSGTWVDLPHPDLLQGDLRRLLQYNSSGAPTLIAGSTHQVGTVFRPGTVVRDQSGRVIGGDPFPNNIIPINEWARNTPAFLKLIQMNNYASAYEVPGSPQIVRMPFINRYDFHKNQKVARIDYSISPSNTFFFRWADDAQHEEFSLGVWSSLQTPVYPMWRKKPGASWSWNLISVVSPSMTNEAIFTYNHLTQLVDVQDDYDSSLYDRDKLGFTFQELYPESNLRNKFPRFNCGVGACNMQTYSSGWLSEGKTFAFTDNFTVIRGTHTLKFGGMYNRNDNGQQPSWTDAINIDFASGIDNRNDTGNQFANMLTGNYLSTSQSNGRFYGNFRFHQLELYAQDSWRMTPKFTLEYGMRWAYIGPTYTHGKYLQNYFDPSRYDPAKAVQIDIDPAHGARKGSIIPGVGDPFNGLVEEGSNGIPKGFMKHKYGNFGPRLGFAYDPWGDGKTSIRGGGGVFYERIRQNTINFDGLGNPPLAYSPTIYSGNVDNISPALISQGVRFPVGLTTFDSAGTIPQIFAWSFGVQRELGASTSLDVSYIGNRGTHLMYRRDINQLPVGTTVFTDINARTNQTVNAQRPYLGFQSINFTEFGANSTYNALQARLSRRFARSFTANVNYAWSKAMNHQDRDDQTIPYAYDREREWGLAGFDRTHVFTFDYVYELPKLTNASSVVKTIANGWQLSGMTRFWTGTPNTINSNGNMGAIGGQQRADWIGGDIAVADPSRTQWFNVAAFGRPADGTLGNAGRNTVRGPGINQWDISLFKTTRLTERVSLQFRLETFNTFNHTQWADVNYTINVPNPGQPVTKADIDRSQLGYITSTRDPRTVQLAMKLMF
jgi:hypothetical protein